MQWLTVILREKSCGTRSPKSQEGAAPEPCPVLPSVTHLPGREGGREEVENEGQRSMGLGEGYSQSLSWPVDQTPAVPG